MKKDKIPADLVYSNKEKFAFIQFGKVGSTSILKYLWNCTALECKTNGIRRGKYIRKAHEFSLNNDIFKEINDTHFTFMFVRNPWDRLVSCYENKFIFFAKKHKIPNPEDISFTSFIYDFLTNDTDFVSHSNSDKHWSAQSNMSFISEINFIGRFENLQEDFNIVCNKIGIPQKKLPHENKSKHKHYTEYYDDETREIVAEKYAKDIEYFGYEFGE